MKPHRRRLISVCHSLEKKNILKLKQLSFLYLKLQAVDLLECCFVMFSREEDHKLYDLILLHANDKRADRFAHQCLLASVIRSL